MQSDDRTPITGEQLRSTYLSPAMWHYLRKKVPHLSDMELEVRAEETLKFLGIATYCSGAIPVSKEIDEIWHYWILQTQEYKALCRAMHGQEFIHHSSNDYLEYADTNVRSRNSLLSDVRMLATYFSNYGPFYEPRVKYWLLASYLCEKRNWSVHQLNAWLTSSGHSRSPVYHSRSTLAEATQITAGSEAATNN
jgi:hypothetical protein